MKPLIVAVCTLFAFNGYSKLIDKTIAIIDSEILTLSESNRTLKNVIARKNISPQIYTKNKYNTSDIVNNFFQTYIIRKNLEKLGFVISKSQVNDQISQTERNLKISRDELLQFLSTNGINYTEYFEITKATIEYNIFLARIIRPLIKITDYELKNKFSTNTKLASNTYNFNLVDFYIPKKSISQTNLKRIREDLITFQKNGNLPSYLKNLETNILNDVKEEGLSSDIKKSLVKKQVNEFSEPVMIGDAIHLFFIKKKSLVESEKFSSAKRQLEQEIFMSKSQDVIKKWLEQEKSKHYIKTYI